MNTMEALQPYFVGLTLRPRLMLYFLATTDSKVNEARSITVKQLKDWQKNTGLSAEFNSVIDELCEGKNEDEKALTDQSGRGYSFKQVTDLLIKAHDKAGIEYTGLDDFRARIKKKINAPVKTRKKA